MKLIKRAGCDERAIYRSHPFLVKDVLFSAILVAANDALLEIAKVVEAPDEERELVEGWAGRGRKGLEKCWDDKLNLCLDYDLRADRSLRVRTVAGFAPLIAGRLSPERLAALLGELDSPPSQDTPNCAGRCRRAPVPKSRAFTRAAIGAVPSGPSPTGYSGGRLSGPENQSAQPKYAGRALIRSPKGASPSTSNRSPASH